MFFHLRDLQVRSKEFEVSIAPGEIDFQENGLRQFGPLVASGRAELLIGSLGEIQVSGHVAVAMEADCDRCLEPARLSVDSEFSLYYRPVEDGFGDEKSIDAGEAEMGFYEGEGLELNDVLREFVLLALPMQCVCKESCKGICPVCGQNRNHKECACQAATTDDRWAALKEI